MRASTAGTGRPSACRASRRSSSSKLSTTMLRTPATTAARSSSTLLLLPWNVSACGRNTCGQGHVHLAATGYVEQHALVVGEASHGLAQERLGGVHRSPGTECGDRFPASGPQVRLVVDEHAECRTRSATSTTRHPPIDSDPSGRTSAVSGNSDRGIAVTSAPGLDAEQSRPFGEHPRRLLAQLQPQRRVASSALSTGQAS